MPLQTNANIADPDGFYAELIAAQRDMSEEDAALMNCKMLILLANHIGDRATLAEALTLARPRQGAAAGA